MTYVVTAVGVRKPHGCEPGVSGCRPWHPGHRIGAELDVVAEGVEIVEQEILLRQYGCALAQGYLYARPQPENELLSYLLTGDPAIPA